MEIGTPIKGGRMRVAREQAGGQRHCVWRENVVPTQTSVSRSTLSLLQIHVTPCCRSVAPPAHDFPAWPLCHMTSGLFIWIPQKWGSLFSSNPERLIYTPICLLVRLLAGGHKNCQMDFHGTHNILAQIPESCNLRLKQHELWNSSWVHKSDTHRELVSMNV